MSKTIVGLETPITPEALEKYFYPYKFLWLEVSGSFIVTCMERIENGRTESWLKLIFNSEIELLSRIETARIGD